MSTQAKKQHLCAMPAEEVLSTVLVVWCLALSLWLQKQDNEY